jgi:tetratricopeptide (TPR) repeat protein
MNFREFDRYAETVDELLDRGRSQDALNAVRAAQEELKNLPSEDLLRFAKLACLLVDIGTDLRDDKIIHEGLTIFIERYDELLSVIQPASLEYNIANAKKSLYDIAAMGRDTRFRPESIELLTEAKNHYWKSIKYAKEATPEPQLLVNLGNALDQCGRVVEALMWYDHALEIDPSFGMAHMNRGQALLFLNQLSDTYTISLLSEAKRAFRLAETSRQLPDNLVKAARDYREKLNQHLLEIGRDDEKIATNNQQHRAEYEEHDDYRCFCLSNYLALCEHALYCNCAGARRDDLSIPKQSGAIGGDFVLRLELLLNRIKSEFCLARSLYYQAVASEQLWDSRPFEGTFTKLFEGDAIGIRPEFLRTSFRLSFGILDRIAQGLSELYSLANSSEVLYFESFWRPRDQQKRGKEERWDLINQQENIGLVALYSLATDLNRIGGEWGFFKESRNDLEHGLLVLLSDDSKELPSPAIPKRIAFETVSIEEFRRRTLHMLQFTRSAIFSFVFCVRNERIRQRQGPAITVTLSKKDIGKE